MAAAATVWWAALAALVAVAGAAAAAVAYARRSSRKHRERFYGPSTLVVGFFHPYCNAGGGGERVLWTAIQTVQQRYKDVRCVVYTGDVDATAADILARTKERFNMTFAQPVDFVFLRKRYLVEDSRYPAFTLLGQSLGSVLLAWEAWNQLVPDVFFDSMGYAFTYALFKVLGGCSVGCYVHYPTISTDMLARVRSRTAAFNNDSTIARSSVRTWAKLLYYRAFARLYGWMGSFADVVMVNSSWTAGHIQSLWRVPARTHIVFPPCDTGALELLPIDGPRSPWIVSVAQFRPEKNHRLQLEALARLFALEPKLRADVRLILVGSSRNAADEARIATLRDAAKELGIEDAVTFAVNLPFADLRQHLATAMIGIHTMRDEHFGIGVVEYMAAGLVPIAHLSGGPKADIVVPIAPGRAVGYLCETADEYAETIRHVLAMPAPERQRIAAAARAAARTRFSEARFGALFGQALDSLPVFAVRLKHPDSAAPGPAPAVREPR